MSLSTIAKDSPVPVAKEIAAEGAQAAFLPYPDLGANLENVPIYVRAELHYYIARMGFLPHTLKLYLHAPWVALRLFQLNNAIMRDERNHLSEHFLYRLSIIASRDNECTYCTAHTAAILQRRFGYDDGKIEEVLRLDAPTDEREAVAREFVHQASLDAGGVTDELRNRLKGLFSPPEVMNIVLVIGFWKMYNTMHNVMGVPLEDPAERYSHFAAVQPSRK